jgi:tRNA1(Val) A37 N6-methylase TrmN6
VSNPPYFSGGERSKLTPIARRDDHCAPQELCRAAAWALRFGGDFYLIHKPEKLAQLISCAAAEGLEAKRLLLVRHRPDAPVAMIALQLRKGGKPGLILEELCLHNADGSPTEEYRSIYHI